MSTPESRNNGRNRAHPRPVRFSREVRLPLAVRKELLQTRAALERHDCLEALHQVRGNTRRLGTLGGLLPRLAGLSKSGTLLKLLGITREYPMVSTAITLAVPLLRRTPIGRWAWKLSKLGAVAGAGYWAYQTWRKASEQAVPPGTGPAPAAGEDKPLDTGFRDPLVR